MGSDREQDRAPAGRLWELVDAGVFIAEELHLDAVLSRIAETACRVIGAHYAAIGVLNEDATGLANFVFHGLTSDDRRRIGNLPVGRGLLGALIAEPVPIRLTDLSQDPRSVGFPANHPPMHSFLGVPIRARGRIFGNLYLTEKDEGDFTDEDERFAIVLAAQAGVAIENARLYELARANEVASARRLVELETVQELGRALLIELDPSRVLRMIAMRARELVRADTVIIGLVEEHSDDLRVRVAVGVRAGVAEGMIIPGEGSFSGRAVATGEPILVDDALRDPRGYIPIAHALNARSVVYAPLMDRRRGIGVLSVIHEEPGRFNNDDLFVVNHFASLAGLALRNAELAASERARSEMEADLVEASLRAQLRDDTLKAVIRGQEEERGRIARELHDSAGQALASILLGLTVAGREPTLDDARARIADLREVVGNAAAEVRRLAHELRPSALDDFGLEAALERQAKDVHDMSGVNVSLEISLSDRPLDPEVETVVYRVVQEALTNAIKHARASTVRVAVEERDELLVASVNDDGRGFDTAAAPAGSGLGLQGMQERADLVGGRIAISSQVGAGASVVLEIPIKAPL